MNAPESRGAETNLKFFTTRFGEVEVAGRDIIQFPEGLLGFNQFNRYIIIKDPDQEPFLWLQALDAPDLAFVVVDPFLFFPGYEIQVKSHELATIQIEDVSKATVLCIVTIPSDPNDITGNLRGPLVFNMEKKLGKQLVLIDDRYTTKHFLLRDLPDYLAFPPGMKPAAVNESNPQPEPEKPKERSSAPPNKKRGKMSRPNQT